MNTNNHTVERYPVVVITGRPNVGKSTLFNRLVGRKEALVSDISGVTRDRKESLAVLHGRKMTIVDTAGLEESPYDGLYDRMMQSSQFAVSRADIILFCVDIRKGVTPADEYFANWLRCYNHPVILVANKAEGKGGATAALEAYRLALGRPIAISAEHGEGIADLISEIEVYLPKEYESDRHCVDDLTKESGENSSSPLKLAVVGRPNVGKSTLVNTLLGEQRVITGPDPGLTRDSITSVFHDTYGTIELVDTAGLRRKARIEHPLEKMSVSASIEALKMAEIVVLVVDANLGLHEQDLQIARLIEREGRACVLAINKWDIVTDRQKVKKAIDDKLRVSLSQIQGIRTVCISALTDQGVGKLILAVRSAYQLWNKRISTAALNQWFTQVLVQHEPPLLGGKRFKLRYITQVKARPPTFIVFGTRAELLPEDYRRYLVNGLRRTFSLSGTPIRLYLRSSKNPFKPN